MKGSPKTVSRAVVAACLLLVSVTSRGTAPAGRYTTSSTTVTDTKTGLIWERYASSTLYNWKGANDCCQALNLGGTVSSRWRVPSVKELQSIVDVRSYSPAIDTSAFPGALGGYYWSSTPYSWTSGQWAVDFTSGVTFNGNVGNAIYVRCVHD